MIKKIPRVQTTNREINQLQINLLQSIGEITSNPITNGIIIKEVELLNASNPTEVNHELGRDLLGWFVVRNRADSYLWDSQDDNLTEDGFLGADRTILLNTSDDTNVDIFVF